MPLEIVKVQVPLSEPVRIGGPCLIYDRRRKHVSQTVLLRHVHDALKGDFKGYFKGEWSSIVGWGISERVPDQNW